MKKSCLHIESNYFNRLNGNNLRSGLSNDSVSHPLRATTRTVNKKDKWYKQYNPLISSHGNHCFGIGLQRETVIVILGRTIKMCKYYFFFKLKSTPKFLPQKNYFVLMKHYFFHIIAEGISNQSLHLSYSQIGINKYAIQWRTSGLLIRIMYIQIFWITLLLI